MGDKVLNRYVTLVPGAKVKGSNYTATEIAQQPEVWGKTFKSFEIVQNDIYSFLNIAKDADEIILTGAGTSSFIGYSINGILLKNSGIPSFVIPTTDIVSFPQNYFEKNKKYLIISFARSGNSPESIAALQLADQLSQRCFHLIISCNKEGELVSYKSSNPVLSFALPPETNDKSLAMTSSYSSMLLTGLLLPQTKESLQNTIKDQVIRSQDFAKKILEKDAGTIRKIASSNFKKAVFLGAGPLLGTAMESALKLQELTNGTIICKFDSFLGFRHGPKAVVHDDTLMVYFINNNPYARKYEIDLIKTMRDSTTPILQIGVGENISHLKELDYVVEGGAKETISEDFQPLSHILVGQLLGFYKSLDLGLNPDAPSLNGAISRVVQGVQIYDFPLNKKPIL